MPHHVLNATGGPRMADVLCDAMRDAVDVSVAVAFVHMSGLQLLLTALKATPGARVRVLTSTYLDVTEPQALSSLRANLGENLRVQHGPRGFHAKCHLLVLRGDRRVGWIGSSNWTLSGLRDNIEWNTRIDDPAAFQAALAEFESLWSRVDVRAIDDAFIAEYTRQRALRALTIVGDGPSPHLAETTRTRRVDTSARSRSSGTRANAPCACGSRSPRRFLRR
jgi:HKD family nuclease